MLQQQSVRFSGPPAKIGCRLHASRAHPEHDNLAGPSRREALALLLSAAVGAEALAPREASAGSPPSEASQGYTAGMQDQMFETMDALKGKDYGKQRFKYPDYVQCSSGLQYKDIKQGSGPTPQDGDTVVLDWAGYTIGYYGRPFEARNKPKGSDFTGDDKDFLRLTMGSDPIIPAVDEALRGMRPGGIRRIIVPPELGYPGNDFTRSQPRPTRFSGQRALDFVIKNRGMIDKTLLFDLEVIKVLPGQP